MSNDVIDVEPSAKPAASTALATPASGTTLTPYGLLQLAVERNADIAQLERLMALHERWEANEARKAYTQAMADFKSEAVEIIKRKVVGYEDRNGNLVGYTHAELYDVTSAVIPQLSKYGLSHSWIPTQTAQTITIECRLTHRLGHSESVSLSGPPDSSGKKNTIQQIASTATYFERYTLLMITGLSTRGMDDDGAGASDHGLSSQGDPINGPAADKTLSAGQDAAMSGMSSLTNWWGGLSRGDRSRYQKEFAGLRKVAQKADAQGASHD